jgi:hypothetical protein
LGTDYLRLKKRSRKQTAYKTVSNESRGPNRHRIIKSRLYQLAVCFISFPFVRLSKHGTDILKLALDIPANVGPSKLPISKVSLCFFGPHKVLGDKYHTYYELERTKPASFRLSNKRVAIIDTDKTARATVCAIPIN